ncbi:DNA polymerase III subunit delta [Lonepinella sp. BR2919]|uniref:DNA polymerase III subunit delta n=1 Tax=unclassified Lonepinella TaxID=2642006 RepID=UPI003F6E013F
MNRIFPEQLSHSLNSSLASIYYLIGQDPLLLSESQDAIFRKATEQGFDEKLNIQIDANTDWQVLFERCQSIGLFFKRQVINLLLPENLTAPLQAKLAELIALLNPDLLFIFQLPKFPKTAEKQAWVKKSQEFEPHFPLVNCQTPSTEQLPRWVAQRVKNMGLTADQDAIQLLCYSHENNLIGLKQSLDLLALLYGDKKLTFTQVQKVVEQSSVFTPFQWIDALLEGKFTRAKRILNGLQNEDIQPIILLRTLQRELMVLLELSKPQQRLESLHQRLPITQLRESFDRLKIWQNRRAFYITVFQRLTYAKLYQIIQQLAELERATKLDFSADVWQQLDDISAAICLTTD